MSYKFQRGFKAFLSTGYSDTASRTIRILIPILMSLKVVVLFLFPIKNTFYLMKRMNLMKESFSLAKKEKIDYFVKVLPR